MNILLEAFLWIFFLVFCLACVVWAESPWYWPLFFLPIALAVWRIQLFRYRIALDIVTSWRIGRKCLGCRYDLSRQESGFDGCTVCPECGAAWKLNAGHPR